MDFHYVYRLNSVEHPSRYYVGLTDDLKRRLAKHNRGVVRHTAKFAPWRVDSAHAFRDRTKAAEFERYLKSHAGREFARRHF